MADLTITPVGVNSGSNAADTNIGNVSIASDSGTLAGHYLLCIASIDFVSPGTNINPGITGVTGVDAWVEIATPRDPDGAGTTMSSRVWLAKVTTNGAKTVPFTGTGGHRVLCQVHTLNPGTGGTITVDGVSTITDRSSPFDHTPVAPAGTKSLLYAFFVAYGGGPTLTGPAGMTEVVNMTAGSTTHQTCRQQLSSSGSTGARAQTASGGYTNGGGCGALFALRSQSADTGSTYQGAASLNGDVANLAAGSTHGRAATANLTAPAALNVTAPALTALGGTALSAPAALTVTTPQQVHSVSAELTAPAALTANTIMVMHESANLSAGASLLSAGFIDIPPEHTPYQRGYTDVVKPQPTRVIAQRIRDGKFLHWDLEVHDLTIEWSLSGPTAISGSFPVEVRELRDLDLEPWGTWLHVEEDGFIRASAILQPAQINEDETLSVDAAGITSYLKGTPYMGEFTLSGTDPASGETGIGLGLDPADIMRNIWAEAQRYPYSNLGVTVVGSTPIRLGTPKQEVSFDAENPDTGQIEQVDFTAGPYSALDWWESADLGSEFDKLAKDTPVDYIERCSWNADKTDVVHWIDLGYPRIGSTPVGVRFAQEENLLAAIGPEEPDDRYASHIIVLGKGEGSARIRGEASRPLGTRLRRVKIVEDKTIGSQTAANARASVELDRCQALADVTEVTALSRHPNASLGAFTVGDDVPIEADVPWVGDLRVMQRILNIVYAPEEETVKLTLRSSSSFSYGGPGQ